MKRLLIPATAVALGLTLAACGSSSSGGTPSGGSTPSTGASSGGGSGSTTLHEAGSSLLYPYLQTIESSFHSANPSYTLSPAAGGSGVGIADAISGTVDMGGSDAYLAPNQLTQSPKLVNIPIVVSSQAVNYNVKGVKNLKLTGNILAQIYEGKITKWNDSQIASINPGVKLPSETIVPVRRVDSSGDTFLFTSFMSATNSTWSNGPSIGTTVTWPSVSGEVTAMGNPGMVQTCSSTPGCVAYIGISAEKSAQQANLEEAMLQNKSGKFLQPNSADVTAAANAGSSNIPANLAQSLIYEPGANSYPIVNFEYIVAKAQQSSSSVASGIQAFLKYAMDTSGGSSSQYLSANQFQPLPSAVLSKAQAAVSQITGS